ncbi:MAG TPA: DUF4142 domain-containing protein [Rhodanobacteraceae bacterium]|nr:DUF4142 domain-containing protein [Rhodanobacteraceae bacterium]
MNPKLFLVATALVLGGFALPSVHAQQILPISDAPLSDVDADFVQRANSGHVNLMLLGRAGENKAAHEGVRALGTNLLHAHTKENDALKLLADAKRVELPGSPDSSQMAEGQDLTATNKGGDFDSLYVATVERDLEDMIAMYEDAAESSDPDIRRYAALTLPALRDQFQDARDLTGKPPGGSENDDY